MKFSPPLDSAVLVRRYKRFFADVERADGSLLTLHCANTGAMTGCSSPGFEVWYATSGNPKRKLPHSLEVVCTPRGRVGVNTARANALVAEALAVGGIPELAGYTGLRREVRVPDTAAGEAAAGGPAKGSERLDFHLQGPRESCWLEVKSLTLCDDAGRGAFPDAVSERALRHVHALAARRRAGERAVLLFCVQHTGVRFVTTADDIHPAYGAALRAAVAGGVEVLAYGCRIGRDEISLAEPLPVRLC